MSNVSTYALYIISTVLLALSFLKDRKKTRLALKKSWLIFLSVLPQFLAILFLVGFMLAVIQPEVIQSIIGAESGVLGMLIASLVGAATIVPVIVAFPIASELLQNGAGIMQITVFVCTLTTVGIVTLPLEIKYLGKKIAILRNALFFIFAFAVAALLGVMLS